MSDIPGVDRDTCQPILPPLRILPTQGCQHGVVESSYPPLRTAFGPKYRRGPVPEGANLPGSSVGMAKLNANWAAASICRSSKLILVVAAGKASWAGPRIEKLTLLTPARSRDAAADRQRLANSGSFRVLGSSLRAALTKRFSGVSVVSSSKGTGDFTPLQQLTPLGAQEVDLSPDPGEVGVPALKVVAEVASEATLNRVTENLCHQVRNVVRVFLNGIAAVGRYFSVKAGRIQH